MDLKMEEVTAVVDVVKIIVREGGEDGGNGGDESGEAVAD